MNPLVATCAALCAALAALAYATAKLLRCRRAVADLRKALQRQGESLGEQIRCSKEAVRAKSDFLSRMSHEIRTPLNAIIGMAQIALNASSPDKMREAIGKVEDSSKHLLGIINDVLDFSKIEAGGLMLDETPFSLAGDVRLVLAMIDVKAKEKGLDLRAEIGEIRHDGIRTDMLRLNQVLLNLLSNAVKFTDAGGRVTLKVEELAHMDGDGVYRFTVEDDGIGIAPEQAGKLFTPFAQANAGISRLYGGTGLGLAIAQNIVRMMGGDIELESEPGKGSVFRFTIRVPAQERVEERPPQAVSAPGNLAGKRILIVDDIEINREVVAGLLDGSGVLIETAGNGKEALEAVLDSRAGPFDLILMDMQMPVMDGCTATREIRACGRTSVEGVKIVAMTANVMQEDVERARAAGMDGYVPKPIDVETLYRVLEEAL